MSRPPDTSARNGVGTAVRDVLEHGRALVRLEGELATIELRRKAASLGAGAALIVAAAVLSLFVVGFALATIAAALATFLPTWLALLLVTLGVLVIALGAGLAGRALVRRGIPPVPEQALEEAKTTRLQLQGDRDG